MDKAPKMSVGGNNIEQTKSLEEKKWDLINFELEYIEKIDKGELKPLGSDKIPFIKMLESYSQISHYIYTLYCKRVTPEEYSKIDCEGFTNFCLAKMEQDYKNNKSTWKKDAFILIHKIMEELGPVVEKNREDEEKQDTGIVEFGIESSPELESFGIGENDDRMSLHLDLLANQKETDATINNIFSGNSLSKIAIKIVDEFPQVKAVTARSWIMSTPIAKRIGFTPVKVDSVIDPSPQFWGQFIDENGNLNKKRAQKFLETGVPEFPIGAGYIKVEDFLSKYLPENRKGVIELKDVTPEYISFNNEMKETRLKIFNFDNPITEEEAEKLLHENQYINKFLKTEHGPEFLALIKEAVKKNVHPADIQSDESKKILKIFEDALKSFLDSKYSIRKVTIQ